MRRFRILAVTLSFLVLLVMIVGCAGPKSIFPDKNLEAAIRDALGKPVGEEITAAELANLTSLSINLKAITDLTGLEYCLNLQKLDLGGNNISDFSVLAGLTHLQVLRLSYNNISDISVLAGLTDLRELDLEGNNISDISPLMANSGLSVGDKVYLSGNPLSTTSIYDTIELEARGVTVTY
jgi:Leucine-rich repeat (LRR) protein